MVKNLVFYKKIKGVGQMKDKATGIAYHIQKPTPMRFAFRDVGLKITSFLPAPKNAISFSFAILKSILNKTKVFANFYFLGQINLK